MDDKKNITDKKLEKMKQDVLENKEKCREIAQKLKEYIKKS